LTDVVVDASVAVKWVLDEEPEWLYRNARQLLQDLTDNDVTVVAPPHMGTELTDAIYHKVLGGEITAHEGERALEAFLRLNVRLIDVQDSVYRDSLTLALDHLTARRPFEAAYDPFYVVLAQTLGTQIWTNDHVLIQSLNPLPAFVKWIGSYPDGDPAPLLGRRPKRLPTKGPHAYIWHDGRWYRALNKRW